MLKIHILSKNSFKVKSKVLVSFWHFIARVIHFVMCGGHHDLTLTPVTLQGSTFAIYYADAERSEALANCLLNATRFFAISAVCNMQTEVAACWKSIFLAEAN